MERNMDLLFEIFTGLPRGGPGSKDSTRRAFNMLPNIPSSPNILDIGCGPGMQTIELAKLTDGKILALDIHQPFLDYLIQNAEKEGLSEKIETINQSMLSMEFEIERFDILWAEGSIFIMTFEKALKQWRKFLKKGGYMAVSELIWPPKDPPEEMKSFLKQYSTIQTHDKNLRVIEKIGYKLINSFVLPVEDWAIYYNPLEERLKIMRIKYKDDEKALQFIESLQNEIDLFRKYPQFFIYNFYIIQK
ncbi:MAG: class I SAM-dependent methyltransferase [Promethearchaeota archaeon]